MVHPGELRLRRALEQTLFAHCQKKKKVLHFISCSNQQKGEFLFYFISFLIYVPALLISVDFLYKHRTWPNVTV